MIKTYEFEPDIVAQMLSPKLPRKAVELDERPTLEDFECLVDEPTVHCVQNEMQQLPDLEYDGWHTSLEAIMPQWPPSWPLALKSVIRSMTLSTNF